MPRIVKRQFCGFATCNMNRKPPWKFWIRIYFDTDENGQGCYYCSDCKNECRNFSLWLSLERFHRS